MRRPLRVSSVQDFLSIFAISNLSLPSLPPDCNLGQIARELQLSLGDTVARGCLVVPETESLAICSVSFWVDPSLQ